MDAIQNNDYGMTKEQNARDLRNIETARLETAVLRANIGFEHLEKVMADSVFNMGDDICTSVDVSESVCETGDGP